MSDWQIDCLTDWLLTIGLLNWQKKVHETKDWEEEEEEEEDEEDEEEEEEKKEEKKILFGKIPFGNVTDASRWLLITIGN